MQPVINPPKKEKAQTQIVQCERALTVKLLQFLFTQDDMIRVSLDD